MSIKVTLQVIEQVKDAENSITCRYEIEFANLAEAISALHSVKDVLIMRALIEPVTGSDSRD